MNQKHIPNLELCQELDRLCKEKNITIPETEFYWDAVAGGSIEIVKAPSASSNITNKERCHDELSNISIPAPLVSEQGEWLKFHSHKSIYGSKTGVAKKIWRWHFFADFDVPELMAETEANARMMGLNYLIAEGIITTL